LVISDHQSLLADVRACHRCAAHLPLGPGPVFQLHPSARILIVGQAPGRKAHETGLPFEVLSGDRLRGWLGVAREIFYDETKIALLPMGFCFPGTGKGGDRPPRSECAATWRRPLLKLLDKVELTIVLGRYALDWHLPDEAGKPLAEVVRGWPARWPRLLALPHPSPRNIAWFKRNAWFETEIIPALQNRVRELLSAFDIC
jgi:uracil-DNA glycosylase